MQVSSPFDPHSVGAQAISDLFILTLLLMGVILIIVTGLVLYIAFRYRSRSGEPEPQQVFGRRWLEITWTILPALLLAVLFGLTVRTMHVADPAVGDRQPDLVVTGYQWWWQVRYPSSGVVTANEIHIPVGRRLLLRLESVDVIHDFWVPQLGRKMDMVPGQANHIWLEADVPGVYLGACAEFCGAQHAWMRLRVIAQEAEAFEAWQQRQLQVPAAPGGGEAARGMQLFRESTCVNCHAIAGTGAEMHIGPDLTHLASRDTLAAGALENTPGNLARWLANPQAVKPGNHMPDLQLPDADFRALAAYLEALQ